MKSWLRIVLVVLLVAVLVSGVSRPAEAAVFDRDGKIGADEVIDDDVFLAADTVVVDGTVNGLLLAAGERVTINGTINGDLIVVGNSIEISPEAQIDGNIFFGGRSASMAGQVKGSFFGGGAAATLAQSAVVGRNLYFGGYSFQTEADSQVGRDLYVGGYQAILAGNVERDAAFGGGALEFSGSVGRDLRADVESSSGRVFMPGMTSQPDMPDAIEPGLRVAEAAQIGNQLIVTTRTISPETIKAQPAAGVVFQTPMPGENVGRGEVVRPQPITVRYPLLDWLWGVFREGVTLLVFGVLALWLLPRVLQYTVDQARVKPGPSAGYGLLTIFGGYFSILVAIVLILLIGIVLGLFSLGGLSFPVFGVGFSALALFVAIFTLLVSTISKVVVSYLIGQLLLDRIAPESSNRQILALIAGVVIYVLVRSIPVVGWLIGIAATLVGIGAMWLAYQAWRKPAVTSTPVAA